MQNALTNIAPLLKSLEFKAGKRVSDMPYSQDDDDFSLAELIAGEPTPLELFAKRHIAEQERKENFWYFLEDHPRYLGILLGAAIFLLLSAKAGIEHLMQDDRVWVNILKRGLGLLAIVVLVIGAFLLLMPFLE